MAKENSTIGFPFTADSAGRINAYGGDEAIRGKIVQVLFTAPGERVNLPDFGCGLFNLVFEPNNTVLTAAMEFSVGQALTRWLADDLVVERIHAESNDESIIIEIVYSKKVDMSKQAVRIQFK
jgi:phage baseplate assembly protein W